ncbi:ddmC [Scenedesmus sp. PABB004]|nr:ddmC [Scenedesmus sp. PABB004]
MLRAPPMAARGGAAASRRGLAPGPAAGRPGRAARCAPVRAVVKRAKAVELAAAEAEESVFLDPLVRSFLLGIGAGVLCEGGHVAFKALSLLQASGDLEALGAAVRANLEQFAPLFVWDHVAALGFWVLLYAIEVGAIISVLKANPDDAQAAVRQARGMMTLSKRMLPLRLGLLKKTLFVLATGAAPAPALAAPAAAASAAAAPAVAEAAPPGALAFTDARVADAVADIEASARAPLGLPTLPPPARPPPALDEPPRPSPPPAPRKTLAERRAGLRPGEWEPASRGAVLDRRGQELVDRKSYLRNFWYAAALSEKLEDGKPLGVDLLGSRVTLFRDGNRVVALDDTCPHRGAPLSEGWLASGPSTGGHTCVVCPYHGWAFDGEGHLRDVPSAEPGRWPKRPLVSSYPVEERGGFVWLFWGDKRLPAEERPPIPFTPELEAPGWHSVYGEIEFECGHWGVFENAIDMAHIHYLHGDSFGNAEKPRIADMATARDTFHVEARFSIHNKPVSALWDWTAVESVPVTAKAMLPSSSAITIQLGAGVSMITFVNTVPISENRSVNRFCLIRNFAGWEGFDGYARRAMMKILGEDKVMVERLTPERLGREFSLGPDAPQVAFRALRQEWVDMGYAVPPESVRPRRGLAPDM